jgi:hypothetical protein
MAYEFNLNLHPTQLEVYNDPHKHKVIAAGKGWGKTNFVTKCGAGHAMTKDDSCGAVIAPFAKQANYDYKIIRKLITEKRIERSSERWMELTLKNGAEIGLFSAENPEAARGYAWDWVIVDEAAFCDPEIFPIIDSQVGKRSGIEWDVSTPNGKNYFYDLYCREETDPKNYKSFHYTTYDNPYYPVEEIERMRLNMDEITFRQEILAEFIEGGLVFPHLADIMTAFPKEPLPGHQYVAGIDLAKVNDFTVIKIADSADNYEVYHMRLPHSDWSAIKSNIYTTLKRYNNATAIIDQTGVGSSVVEDLQKMTRAWEKGPNGEPEAPEQGHLFLVPVAFSQVSKPELFRNYIMAQNNFTIHLINDPVVKKEHEQMLAIKSEALMGYVKYTAPKKKHDDTVIAAALMCWGLDRYAGNQLAGPFTDNELNPLLKKKIDPANQIDVEEIIRKSESRQIAGLFSEEDQNICSNYD